MSAWRSPLISQRCSSSLVASTLARAFMSSLPVTPLSRKHCHTGCCRSAERYAWRPAASSAATLFSVRGLHAKTTAPANGIVNTSTGRAGDWAVSY